MENVTAGRAGGEAVAVVAVPRRVRGSAWRWALSQHEFLHEPLIDPQIVAASIEKSAFDGRFEAHRRERPERDGHVKK